uniref:YadA-like protein n=1 Tax=Myoviridae sp. ctIty1 TaxID=2827673 RepID=A0A8S5TGV6_9CAUD|nr:MAG TPA: YadA-like protein [Myoviridae sp. ctIty1]
MKKQGILLTAAVLASLTAGSAYATGSNIGYNNTSNGTYGMVIGSNNTAEAGATSSFVLGDTNTVKQANSFAFGQGNTSDGENSFVGGDKAKAVGRDTFAFGSSAEALTEYTIAIGSQARTIGYNTLAIGNGATVSGPSSIAIGRTNNVTGENSVAIGANNGTIKGEQAVVVGYNNKMTTADQEQLIFGSNSVTSGQGSIVVGTHGQATAVDTVALGNNTIADVQNGIAIGTNSVTESAVGTSNIKDNTTDIRFSNATYAGSTPDSVVSFGTNGRAGAGGVTSYTRQLQNVAAGRVSSTSTDAINGSQLYDVALEAQKYNTLVNGSNTTVESKDNAFGRKEYKVNVNKDLVDMNSASFGKVTDDVHSYIGKDKAHFFDGTTSTNTKVDANGMKLENTDNLDAAEYTMDGMTANSNGKSISFTTNGISAGDQNINNVKTGVADTDAVNVKQLKDSISTESVISDNQVDNIAAVRVTNGKSTGDANAQYGVYVSKNTVIDIAKAANKFEGDSVIKVETTTGANHTADTTTFKFDGNEAAKVLPVSYKANGGTVNKVMADKGFNFVNGNHINASVGADGLVRFDLDQNIPNQINSNTNAINGLSDKVAKNHKISERGIAGTAALAALHPLDFDPDHKLDVMAGYGHFHGSNSVALGMAYRPNEDLMFTVGSTVGNGDTVVNAGISYKVGAKSDVSRSKVSVAKDVADMKREMEAMKAQNAKITAILNAVLGADLPEDQTNMFPDVPANHWAYEAVNDMAKRGLVIGYEDGQFKGDRTMTRYEFAMIVERAIQKAKELNTSIDGRLVDEFKPELLRFEIQKNGSLERVHTLKSNKEIQRDSYGTIVTK